MTISACGNFAVLGSANGRVERFNMQSGLTRGEYGSPGKLGSSRKTRESAHLPLSFYLDAV